MDTAEQDVAARELLSLSSSVDRLLDQHSRELRFPAPLEQRFEQDTGAERGRRFQMLGLVAMLLYNLFLFTDRDMLPDVYLTAWKIRLGVVTPAILLVVWLIGQPRFAALREALVSLLLLLSTASIVVIFSLSYHSNATYYHMGIVLILMFGNIVVRLRFWYALVVCALTQLVYSLALMQIGQMPVEVKLNNGAVLFVSIVISLIANFQMEYDLRRDYLVALREQIRNLKLAFANAKLEVANAELSRLSSIDPLTGLANRRSFSERLEIEWRRASRDGQQLALLFVDVDHFKAYNDTYGHQAGDDCLVRVASTLKNALHRPHDFLARFGGEEFVALLPQTALDDAMVVAERLCLSIAAMGLPHSGSSAAHHVTVSVGMAAMPPTQAASPEQLMEAADQALYLAKGAGRNQVKASDG